jgi:hypothetical protein
VSSLPFSSRSARGWDRKASRDLRESRTGRWDETLEDDETSGGDPSGLSEEQADTDRLIRRLLGTAIADRYADFCRLSSGRLPLTVSRPLAGHALRELDSLIRHVLAVPMDARAVDDQGQKKLRREARRLLRKMGFDDGAIQRAGDGLKPRFSHKAQIEKITARLGLSPDSDVTKLWIELNETYGRVHERSFHERLQVDDEFRRQYAQRFDTVVRGLVVQLQDRYAPLMRRAKEIAAMPPAEGIKLFVREIPGAIQLHLYFYENLPSDGWLPFLEEEGLLREPLPDAQISGVLRLWGWPVGRYLVRMAESENAATRKIVERSLRALKSSKHPDVQRLGLDIVAALPADEAATLADVIAEWLTPDTAQSQASPHKIITMLAGAGHIEAALRVTEAVFQVFERGGELTGFFDPVMYEHYMNGAVSELAKAAPLLALPQFCDLLLQASGTDRRLANVREEDYSYYMVGSLTPGPADGSDILATIIRAIVKFAVASVEVDPSSVRSVLGTLANYSPKIFRRIELHVLARAPSEAADRAETFLADPELIDAGWCRQEYGELATAWFPHLEEGQRQRILAFIDSVAEDFLETWHVRFEEYEKRKAGPEDDRKFRDTTFRDLVWEWRGVLPPDRRKALDKTVQEFGDPDSWRNRHYSNEPPPLSRVSMQNQPVEHTVAYLAAWHPEAGLQTHTAAGLATELREAAFAKPELFSAGAAKFGGLRPVFIRNMLDGLRMATANGAKIEWAPCLELLGEIVDRAQTPRGGLVSVPGDDPDWSWALHSAIAWLASALSRGASGVAFVHADIVQSVVLALYREAARLPAPIETQRGDLKASYFASIQTARGAAVDLCVLLLFWQSKDPASVIGGAPREALAHSPALRTILDVELADHSPTGWMPRAVLGRYLTWLFHYGEDWLRGQLENLFPSGETDLVAAAWLGHVRNDSRPVGDLTDRLQPHYAAHIACLGRDDAPPGYRESSNRLVEYLMILFLFERLPQDLLRQFWDTAPAPARSHAMWFMGRHMVPTNDLRARAMMYWEERLEAAMQAADPEPFRRELGTIGRFFLWEVDGIWLTNQLLRMLNAGFAPNDAFGVIDNLAKLVPTQIEKVIEATNLLVRQPNVQAWIFASQAQSLRTILEAGKASDAPRTAATVKEIVSYLASRGNPGFLDLDD